MVSVCIQDVALLDDCSARDRCREFADGKAGCGRCAQTFLAVL